MEQILKHFTNLTARQKLQLEAIGPLYLQWNQKINVISRKDIENLYEHHILHSLAIAKIFNFNDGSKILDAGTGGGFPGLPLAIMFPDVDFVLVDSTAKKLKVVNDISNTVGLKNITTLHCRLEEVDKRFDFVVSRAVTRLDKMWYLIKDNISNNNVNNQKNGLIYLKGGDISKEVPVGVQYKEFDLSQVLYGIDYFTDKKMVYLSAQ